MNAPAPGSSRLTSVQWLVCVIAAIGFAFDIYELLMLPLVLPPALAEFGITGPDVGKWVGYMFFIPAFVGGIFGLLGGYLTDRLGRRRVLTWSILLYAFSAFAAGYSTNVYMLLFFRCTTFVGVCVEFVAAVAWLAELFPDPKQRERVLGYTQAFSSVGGLLVAVANGIAIKMADDLPAVSLPAFMDSLGMIKNSHAPWRYTLMSGLIPAIPLIVIRPFLPESPSWKRKKDAGTLKRPRLSELFAPELRRTTIITTAMFAMSYGAAFGAIQQMTQIAPGMPDVKASVAAATAPEKVDAAVEGRLKSNEVQKLLEGKSPEDQRKILKAQTEAVAARLKSTTEQAAASNYTKVQEVGGLVGRFLLAMLVIRIVSRRSLIRIFQVPGLVVLPITFGFLAMNNQELFTIGNWHVTSFAIGMFLTGLFTVAQFSFWGNYLPRVYPLHLRGTGESFAANIGGRMIGTSFAALSSYLATTSLIPGSGRPEKLALTAAIVGASVYLVGIILSFWLPEPKQQELME
jgi:MFS family permease